MAVKRLIWAHLWSLLGAVGLLFALTPFPPPAQATLPYLNSSICLATVAATAFVDGNGAKVILGWPTSMPSTLPAAASCLPIGAVFPITTSQSLSIQPAAIQDPVSAEIDSRPGGVSIVSHCENLILTAARYITAISQIGVTPVITMHSNRPILASAGCWTNSTTSSRR